MLTAKITMLHKVSLILIDLMKERDWSEDDMIPYMLAHKKMLIINKPIPGLADDDDAPAVKPAMEVRRKGKGGQKRKAPTRKPEKGIVFKKSAAKKAKSAPITEVVVKGKKK